MEYSQFYIGTILTVTLVWCSYWHVRENRSISRQWQNILDKNSMEWLTRFAWSRSIQLLSALTCCTLIIIIYEWQLSYARSTIITLNQNIGTQKIADVSPEKTLEKNTGNATPLVAEAPITSISPETTASNTTEVTSPIPTQTVEDVYNPSGINSQEQSALDGLKKRYEDILVNYFFLRKCGRISPGDYHIIISALSQEMASTNAPGRLQNDILTAAKGSYHEVYEQAECSGSATDALYTQYISYIEIISKQYTAE